MKILKVWMPVVLVIIAVIVSFIVSERTPNLIYSDDSLRSLVFFSIGIQGLWAWLGHIFCSKEMARSAGDRKSTRLNSSH